MNEKGFKNLKEDTSTLETTTPESYTNGHAVAQNGVESSSTGKSSHPYKFKKGDRFSDVALLNRVLQKYDGELVRVGQVVYAFDSSSSVWRAQKTTQEMLYKFVDDVIDEVVGEPEFLSELCSANGEVSIQKFKTQRARFKSHTLIRNTVAAILQSPEIKRKNFTDFDKNPVLLLTKSGVLNILTGDVREAKGTDYLLSRTEATWNPDADYSWWESFLLSIFSKNENPEGMVQFMQKVFGYSLTTSIDEQKLFVHYGRGSNGKSKVLEALEMLTGDYSTRIDCSSLSKTKNALVSEFNRLGAKLEGKRVAIIDDLDTATQWNEGFVKMLTGPKLPMRKLYEEERVIPNRAKFHIGCNEVPRPESENYGILRRICIIPYMETFKPDAAFERELRAAMCEGLPDILKWAVEGARSAFQGQGVLGTLPELENVAEEYREENFNIEMTVEELISMPQVETEAEWVPLSELTKVINDRLPVHSKVTTFSVGRLLRERYGFLFKRAPNVRGVKREMLYLVKKNYSDKTVEQFL